MPVLDKNSSDFISVPVQDIICVVNLQHDCAAEGKCTQRQIAKRQEREDTNRTRHVVKHTNNQRYILNTQGLHGVKHVCRALPSKLLEWRGLQIDWEVAMREAVQKLASASAKKARQAEARKVAKESYKSIIEGTLATESESERRTTKRKRITRLNRAANSVNETGIPPMHPPSSSNHLPPPSSVQTSATPAPPPVGTSAPASYSDFWARFHRAA